MLESNLAQGSSLQFLKFHKVLAHVSAELTLDLLQVKSIPWYISTEENNNPEIIIFLNADIPRNRLGASQH